MATKKKIKSTTISVVIDVDATNKLNNLLESTEKKLIKAQEEYLLARGWVKFGKRYSPNKRVSFVWPMDKVVLKQALRAQEDYES